MIFIQPVILINVKKKKKSCIINVNLPNNMINNIKFSSLMSLADLLLPTISMLLLM